MCKKNMKIVNCYIKLPLLSGLPSVLACLKQRSKEYKKQWDIKLEGFLESVWQKGSLFCYVLSPLLRNCLLKKLPWQNYVHIRMVHGTGFTSKLYVSKKIVFSGRLCIISHWRKYLIYMQYARKIWRVSSSLNNVCRQQFYVLKMLAWTDRYR
jgi:hypothetical protein